ncbi:HD domain-containing phosphohydrolase [Alkaliphilus transvaalensis]|uniref:HD domain-containing phosphohydrolase n=1 Tax=Alkaliphilus transvaalensis TaxID=114628 RepID=UPI0006878586|nr:HD domain-containing phosphohydrolase [Alkaliphilus transvaalensis]
MSTVLGDLMDVNKMDELAQYFYHIAEVPFAILDLNGKLFAKTPNDKVGTQLCGIEHCFHQALLEHYQAKTFQKIGPIKYTINQCSNGLMCVIAPLTINDELIAYLFINHFFIEKPNFDQLHSNIKDRDTYLEKLLKVPVIDENKLKSMIIYLTKWIDVIGESSINQLRTIKMQEELNIVKHEMEASFQQLAAAESELMENYEYLVKKEKALKDSEQRYRLLFSSMNQGIAHHEIITDKEGKPFDFKYIGVNPSFEKITGFKAEDIVGRTEREIFTEIDEKWMKVYGEVALKGIPKEFEKYSKKLDKYFKIFAYSPKFREFALLVSDITEEKKLDMRLKKSLMEMVESLGYMIEKRDLYTAGHQKNVSKLACRIGMHMGLSEEQLEGLYVASILHDIGKIGIPSEILTKPAKLNTLEFDLIKTHPQNAYEILKSIDFQWPVADIVLQHHEKLDGSGYPFGLKAKDILLEAKIITVADVVEAIASHRPYRPALGFKYALEEIKSNSGIFYDPHVVETCLMVCRKDTSIFDNG